MAKHRKYHIQRAVNFILDPEKSRIQRAIKLFVLMVVLHTAESTARVVGPKAGDPENSLIVRVPRRILRSARFLAAMKFLDDIETDQQAVDSEALNLIRLAAVPAYAEIFDRIIIKNGGWNAIRYSLSIPRLDAMLNKQIDSAKNVSAPIDFSARVTPNPRNPKVTGGVTMGYKVFETKAAERYYQLTLKKTKLFEAWRRQKCAAPFLYLIHRANRPLDFGGLLAPRSTERWLAAAENREKLISFFDCYNQISKHLQPRGYHYTELVLPFAREPLRLSFMPFNRDEPYGGDLLDEIAAYG